MTLPYLNLLFSMIITAAALLAVRTVQKRWQKGLFLVLGAIAAGVIVFLPSITVFLNARQAPTDADILRLLYGDDVPIQVGTDGESVFIIEKLTSIEREKFGYASQVNTEIVGKAHGWDHDPQKYLILTRTGPPACCDASKVPALGAAVLSLEDTKWQVDAYQKLITPCLGCDALEGVKIEAIGPRKTAAVLREYLERDGVSAAAVVLLAAVDARLKVIARIDTGANNQGVCAPAAEDVPCWSYTADYQFVPGEDPAYHDIIVTVSGTALLDGELVSIDKTTRHVFSNGAYQAFDNDQ